jgi:D-cysteine desulfhydrase
VAELPLLRRYPALSALPYAPLGNFPTPVQRVTLPGGRSLWVKRDDLTGDELGGNKVRALEWLLGGVGPGVSVLTVGPRGSTHALTTAFYAKELGAMTLVMRWNQEMNAAARVVDARLRQVARVADRYWVPLAYLGAIVLRRMHYHWVPAGGTTPVGILGHVNAGLELAEQIGRGECPTPDEIVVPLGTGGTVAGVWLGLCIAGLRCRVRAVRVAPRIIASRARIARLIQRTRKLMEGLTDEPVPSPWLDDLVIENDYYGGGYGHAIPPSPGEAALAEAGVRLDDTYSRKTFAAAVARSSDTTLFWLTFDGRLLQD